MAFFIVVKYSSHKIYHLKLFLNVQFSKSHPYREEKIINKEKWVGEGGLNGRLRGLRKRRFLIRGRQEDVNFSGEGKEHKM